MRRAWLVGLIACGSARPLAPCVGTKPAIDLRFEGVREGAPAEIALADYLEPCAREAKVLLLRVGAGWCGTCQWQARHTSEITGPRAELLDVLVAGADNDPARAPDLEAFRGFVVASGARTLAADPSFSVRSLLPERVTLPAIVVLDRRTMARVDVITAVEPALVRHRIDAALARLDGAPEPTAPVIPREDDRFARWEVEMTRAMLLPGPPPPNPTNAKADDPLAASLGQSLFEDTGFSANGSIACVTCHRADKAYADDRPRSKGLAETDRNAPSITLAAHGKWAFWDGRADSLWSQALGPAESPAEMGSSRLRIAHRLASVYRARYESVFGPMPSLSMLPMDGRPGDLAWESLSPHDKTIIDTIFANFGKAIEAHERKLRAQPSALDRYILGDRSALTAAQKDGLHAFFEVGCAQCHFGPRLTDDAFHALRFPGKRQDGAPDRGRLDAFAALESSPFRRGGPFSDAPSRESLVPSETLLGAFKTPTLRGLPQSGPYGHAGNFESLEAVIELYAKGGDPTESTSVGTLEPWLIRFEPSQAQSLLELLKILDGEPQN